MRAVLSSTVIVVDTMISSPVASYTAWNPASRILTCLSSPPAVGPAGAQGGMGVEHQGPCRGSGGM
jgi:hypothetical protein